MKSADLITTRINNDVIIEQLKNSRCTFARGSYIQLPKAWEVEQHLDENQIKLANEYDEIVSNIEEYKRAANCFMIKSNKKCYKVEVRIENKIELLYNEFVTTYYFYFEIYECTNNGYRYQWTAIERR